MNIHEEAAKLWLRTYEKMLFTKADMPGYGESNLLLNHVYIAKKADDVVTEFKKRYCKK